jgi:clan AA aspartic protease
MGFIYADIELSNRYHELLVLDGLRKPEEMLKLNIKALVDTGSITIVINEDIQRQLQFPVLTKMPTTLADGTKRMLEYVDQIVIRFGNRECIVQGYVLPGDAEVLLGAIPIEYMDVIIDLKNQILTVNPEHPEGAVGVLKGNLKNDRND